MKLKTHSMKLSVTALLVAGAFGFGTAAAADIINDTRPGQQTFSYETAEVRGSTLSNSSGIVIFANGSAVVNITGGNTITGSSYGVFANSDAKVNISGKNTITATGNSSYAVYANSNSTLTISGENTISNTGGGYLVYGNGESHISIDGNNTFTAAGSLSRGVYLNGSSTADIAGTNTFDMAGTAFNQNGTGALTFTEGSQTTVKNASTALYVRNTVIEKGAAVVVESSRTTGVRVVNANSTLTVKGNLDVTSSGSALTVNGNSNLSIDGGNVTLAAAEGGKAITEYNPSSDEVIAVTNAGSLTVKGDVSDYSGSYSLAGNSSASFTALTVNNKLTAADSTVSFEAIDNQGTMELTDSVVNANGTAGTASKLGKVNASDTSFKFGEGTYEFAELNGQGNEVVLSEAEHGKVKIASASEGSTLAVVGTESTDNYADPQAYAQALADSVVDGNGTGSAATTVVTPESDLFAGTTSQIVDGRLVWDPSQVRVSSELDGLNSLTVFSAVNWRHEMNSLSKRMGELRDSPAGVGSWARIYGSRMSYGAAALEAKNTTVQVGTDFSVGDWRIGAAFNYTDGEASYGQGDADSKSYGFAVYGTWLIPCGAYVDLIAKYMRMDNDFNFSGLDGGFDNNAFSVSAETGYRFTLLEDAMFIEPQVGVSYGTVKGDDFTAANGVRVEQDDYNSLLGRIGVRTGFKFPDNKGTVYARVSGVYDFDGEMSSTAYKNQAHIEIKDDIGGAYVEYGVGANFNLTEKTHTYLDLQRTSGGEVDEEYRWNVGIRHVF